jgi:hypothetical protein
MTPQEQKKIMDERDKELDKVLKISKAVRFAYSIGKIKNYGALLSAIGYEGNWILSTYFPSELTQPVLYKDIQEKLDDLRIEVSTRYWLKLNPPPPSDEKQAKLDEAFKKALEKDALDDKRHEELDKDYGWVPAKTEKAKLYWFQKKTAQEMYSAIMKGARGQLLLAPVGVGKTFMYGALLAKLREEKFHQKIGCMSPWPYLIVTKANIVEQTKRVLENHFGMKHPRDVMVINIDQLRSKFGELFVDEVEEVKDGIEVTTWKWRDLIYPGVIVWDECQILKNSGSTQHKIAASYNELANTYQIFSSATPFTRVAEAKCFAVATRLKQKLTGPMETELTNTNWNLFAQMVSSPHNPIDHSPPAVEKFMERMEDYVVRVQNVRPQFHAKNKVHMIDFITAEGKKFYDKAIERFTEKKKKIDLLLGEGGIDKGTASIMTLVAIQQYRLAAESNPDRVLWLANNMYKAVQEGYSAVCAVNFKQTITKCVVKLNEMGVDRNLISLIWGGASKKASEKQVSKAAIQADPTVMAALAAAGITLDDLDMGDEVEANPTADDLPKHLRLGSMTQPQRQNEIDNFQKGKSLYCFYTFKSGGVGLSLHHTDEFTIQKVRHKKSGYAFKEDIANIPTRPRITYVAPTWSAIELVQGIGRAPRLTSLSDTQQLLVFFRGTWEEQVAKVVSVKLRCLSKVVKSINKESWEDMIVGYKNPDDFINDSEDTVDEDEVEGIDGVFIDAEENLNQQQEAA